jgi:hypothetical protein
MREAMRQRKSGAPLTSMQDLMTELGIRDEDVAHFRAADE